MENNEVELIKD